MAHINQVEFQSAGTIPDGSKGVRIADYHECEQVFLRPLDKDNSGYIDNPELIQAAIAYKHAEDSSRFWKQMFAVSFFVFLLALGSVGGLIAAVVELSKESTVSGGALRPAGDSNTIVHTDSMRIVSFTFVDLPLDELQRLLFFRAEVGKTEHVFRMAGISRLDKDTTIVFVNPVYVENNGQVTNVVAVVATRCADKRVCNGDGENRGYLNAEEVEKLLSSSHSSTQRRELLGETRLLAGGVGALG